VKISGEKIEVKRMRRWEGIDECCALRAFHLKSASLEVKFRTED
jgi:hypothetical protein